jgi:hypothetical protein
MPYTAGGWVGNSLTDQEEEMLTDLRMEGLFSVGTIRIAKSDVIKSLEQKGELRIIAVEPMCYVVDPFRR